MLYFPLGTTAMDYETLTCFGVTCKTQDGEQVIELAPLKNVKDRNGTMREFQFPIVGERTLIRCNNCELRHEYQNSDMIRFERPMT